MMNQDYPSVDELLADVAAIYGPEPDPDPRSDEEYALIRLLSYELSWGWQ